jgi:hypothetical protein
MKCVLLVVFIYGSIQLRYEDLGIKTHLAIRASNKCASTGLFRLIICALNSANTRDLSETKHDVGLTNMETQP